MRMNWGRVQGRPLAWLSMNGDYCGHCFVVAQPCAMESHLEETTWRLKVLKDLEPGSVTQIDPGQLSDC